MLSRLSGDVRAIVIGTILMAAVSTFADAFWAAALPEHKTIYGLVHGGIVLGVLGVVLAWLSGGDKPARWGLVSIMVGVFAAAIFYGLYPFVGVAAMVVAWMGLWLAFAAVTERAASRSEGTARMMLRGVLAAIMAGLGFWFISGIWLGPHDPGLLYWRNFVAWCVAFAPGFLALLAGRDLS